MSLLRIQRIRDTPSREWDLTRSVHDLGKGPFDQPYRSNGPGLNRRKSAIELTGIEGKHRFEVAVPDIKDPNVDVLRNHSTRRRRFTRKQRKSLTIEPETGLILAAGVHTSSEDEDPQPTKNKRSHRGLSASTTAIQQEKLRSKGPSARRTRKSRLDPHQAQSVSDLRTEEHSLQGNHRSMSVRDLNGQECDFNNKESVTKWTSQILAELDSLPSSCVDLTKQNQKTRLSEPPEVPPHRPVSFQLSSQSETLPRTWEPMTTSLYQVYQHSPARNDMSDSMSYSVHPLLTTSSVEWKNEFDAETTRTRENSLGVSTLVGSSTESEADTPTATTPVDELQDTAPVKETASTTKNVERRSVAVQNSPYSTMESQKRTSESTLQVTLNNSLQTSGSDKLFSPSKSVETVVASFNFTAKPTEPRFQEFSSTTNKTRQSDDVNTLVDYKPSMPRPPTLVKPEVIRRGPLSAFRPIDAKTKANSTFIPINELPSAEAHDTKTSRDSPVRMRRNSVIESNDIRLMSTIARLSQTVYGEDSRCIPSIRTSVWDSEKDLIKTDDDQLSTWRQRAVCREKDPMDAAVDVAVAAPRSVDRVVASLIRSVELNRYRAPDTPEQLIIDNSLNAQDVGTQTSPFSISRSSSFDWVTDPSEGGLRSIATPLDNHRSEKSGTVGSSSETDDADREVALLVNQKMNSWLDSGDKLQRPGQQSMSPMSDTQRKTKEQWYAEIDESIAMLMEYTLPKQESPVSAALSTSHSSKSSNEVLSSSFPTIMSESVYDNLPESRKRSQEPPVAKPRTVVRQASRVRSFRESRELRPDVIPDDLPDGVREGDRERAGSCEFLNAVTCADDLGQKLKKSEEDALESCLWLRKAGFPQYAKQYEEGQFPIDIRSAFRDHRGFDQDSLRALGRRLDTLNRCAIMRVDNVVLRNRNNDYAFNDMYGFDDEDNIALSENWRYQRTSHTWSRVGNESLPGASSRVVSTKPDTYTRDPYAVRDTRLMSPYEDRNERIYARERTTEPQDSSPQLSNSKLQRSQSERIKERARNIMKKMDFTSNRRRRESRSRPELVIGDPVLVSYDSASPENHRMLPRTSRPQNLEAGCRVQPRSKSARRQGLVLLSPSSPESSSEDSFRDSHHHRHLPREAPSSHSVSRRDISMPPRALPQRREKQSIDSYLYPSSPLPNNRSRWMAPYPGVNGHGNNLGINGHESSPRLNGHGNHSTSHVISPTTFAVSPRSAPPYHTRLVVQDDGYYMHDLSPETSLNRTRLRAAGPQLRVDVVAKSQSSLDNTDDEPGPAHQRRDSGVGSSLSRSPSGPSALRIRQSILPQSMPLSWSLSSNGSAGSWPTSKRKPFDRLLSSSLTASTASDGAFFSDMQLGRCIDSLNAVDMMRLRKLSLLRVTAILERYMGPGNAVKLDIPHNGPAQPKNWTVQKLFKRIKDGKANGVRDGDDNSVFGQPLESIYKRTGQCLPRTVLEMMRYLRPLAAETVGLFRKNGVKSRIGDLRSLADCHMDQDRFVDVHRLDASQVHDIADVVKQYFRELPDPLMTTRYSETFANIFIHVPVHERTSAVQFALLLLPEEHREALQTLILFLADVAKHSSTNNMPAQNLAVCFTPSIFHLSASRLDKITPNRRHKTVGASGMPTEREMRETRAAQECLCLMIDQAHSLFLVPENALDDRAGRSDCEEDSPILKELGLNGPRSYLFEKLYDMIRDHGERWKSWIVEGTSDGVEISSRKPQDNHPIRPLRLWVDIAAPPKEVMHRITKERPAWDSSVINWRPIDILHAPDTDLHQLVLNDSPGHPTRDCYLARLHRSDLTEIRGACAVVERSVHCSETQLLGGVSVAVLDQRYLIEPKAGYSRVTFIARIDLRGRSAAWYNKTYSLVLARQLGRLRDSFLHPVDDGGPETKI